MCHQLWRRQLKAEIRNWRRLAASAGSAGNIAKRRQWREISANGYSVTMCSWYFWPNIIIFNPLNNVNIRRKYLLYHRNVLL